MDDGETHSLTAPAIIHMHVAASLTASGVLVDKLYVQIANRKLLYCIQSVNQTTCRRSIHVEGSANQVKLLSDERGYRVHMYLQYMD